MRPLPIILAAVLVLLAPGCKKSGGTAAGGGASVEARPATGAPLSAAGITFNAPAGWQRLPDRPMRVATLKVPPAAGAPDEAECAVFFFGAGQGGGVQANIDRWIGQITQPDGKNSAELAKKGSRQVAGMAVSTVDVSGTYMFQATPMSGEVTPKPGFRMLAAIVEAPQGSVFFKFTGPATTVAAAQPDFEGLVGSAK